jgi:hypothetical protein
MSYTWRVHDASADEHSRREAGIAPGKVSLTSALSRKPQGHGAGGAPASPGSADQAARDGAGGAEREELADPFDFSPDAMQAATKHPRRPGAGGGAASHPAVAHPAVAHPTAAAPPAQPPLARVRAAIAAADVPALVILQRELRGHLVHPTAEHPAEPAREALAAARHWEMERVVAIRASYASRLAAARAAAPPAAASSTASPAAASPAGMCAPPADYSPAPPVATHSPAADHSAAPAAAAAPGGMCAVSDRPATAASTAAPPAHRGAPAHRGRAHRPRRERPAPPAPNPAVEPVETAMDGECAPFLDALLEGDPQHRYQHTPAIEAEVFDAVRLHVARRGSAQVGHRPEAETESRAVGGVHTGQWCGAFAYTQAARAGGFTNGRVDMQHERAIRHALNYDGRQRTWIWTGADWQPLREYHRARGSERLYQEVQTAAPAMGIRPGDLVLIDNNFGVDPDHITTAVSFDGNVLTTVGGNQGAGQAGVGRDTWDLRVNPAPNDVRATEGGERVRRVDSHLGRKHVRVHGIGRWSLVDYEQHIYAEGERPTVPPSADDLARIQRTR